MQCQQTNKLEFIGRLVCGVTHDYNNSLSAIIGYTELAIEEIGKNELAINRLKEVLKAAYHAKDITSQLLTYARNTSSDSQVHILNDSIEGMLKLMPFLIGEDIRISWLPGEGLWPVKIGSSQTEQILSNLCINASDAITGAGKIIIETKNRTIENEFCLNRKDCMSGDYVMLAVSDDGCGIDKRNINNVLQPFYTSKNHKKGTGLGLSIVNGIVNQHKGFIKINSEVEKGTRFEVYLPRMEFKATNRKKIQSQIPPQSCGETVMLVEDYSPILELLHKILDSLGYRVLMTDSPEKALKIAREFNSKIDLLITDVVMPKMSGLSLAKHMNFLYPNLKCLYMSGYPKNLIANYGIVVENVQFIEKPINKSDLAFALRRALEK